MGTDLKQDVLNILELHRGNSRAIIGHRIAALLGMKDDRTVREVIRELIREGYPVVASVSKPYGYFLCENEAERQDYLAQLRSRLIEDAKRRRDFKVASAFSLDKVTQGKLL